MASKPTHKAKEADKVAVNTDTSAPEPDQVEAQAETPDTAAASASTSAETPADESAASSGDQVSADAEAPEAALAETEGSEPSETPAPADEPGVDMAPSGYQAESAAEPGADDAPDAEAPEAALAETPLPAEWIILREAASFGPVTVGGRAIRCKKGVLYQVPDVEERAAILGTGYFRSATTKDLAQSREPSSGPGGSITRELLPPGALKGGLNTP